MNIFAICQQAFDLKENLNPSLWSVISNLWSTYWLWVVIGLGGWIIVELLSRNGRLHYNSRNGFSPAFNRLIGGGTYFGLQALIYLILRLIFGLAVYCQPWPYAVHVIAFALTGLLLRKIRFWVY